jgi:periplasmic protein TonB
MPPSSGHPTDLPGGKRRWTMSLALVLAGHALPALVAAYWLGPSLVTPVMEPAILLDLEPPAAPPNTPAEQPRQRREVQLPRPPLEREVVETSPTPIPDPALPLPEPDLPPQQTLAVPESAAPPPSRSLLPSEQLSTGQTSWQALLLGHLDRYKRYPQDAQRRRQQGVPWVRFIMNREGKVLSAQLERSSGFRTLDAEAVSLPGRAQPLPKPPEDVLGPTLEFIVPVEFFIR